MSWVQQKLVGVRLGDARREKRLIRIVEDLAAQPRSSIPSAAQGWAETKAAYRLMENPAQDWRAVLKMYSGRTEERILQLVRCANCRYRLSSQDLLGEES